MTTQEQREESFSVSSFETDLTGQLSLTSLFERFQDVAGKHATSLGVGFGKLRDAGVAWMLSRIKVEIASLPRWGENVTLRTWPKGVNRLFALRDFKLASETGTVLARATTCWLLVDLEKGKPRRVESLNVDLQFPGADHAIAEVPDKLGVPAQLQGAYEKRVFVSDLDVNEHVNNAQYVRWITDCFNPSDLKSKTMRSIQINYLDQVLCGDLIAISISDVSEKSNLRYIEGVNKKNNSRAFQALIQWEERTPGTK